MMDRLVEYWNSNKIEWHLDRGLKLQMDGTPLVSAQSRCISSHHVMSNMNKY